MRLLSIDLGDRRTGLARGDSETGIVSPLGTVEIPRGDRLLDHLAAVLSDEQPDTVILGLPLNMDGSEGPRAELSRAFGEQLSTRTGCRVVYQDERLTSHAAEQSLARSGRTHKQKKKIRDALAAVEILRDHLRDL